MKTLASFFLLIVFGCCGQDTSGITNKVTEIDRDKDGKIDVRIETVYRGKTAILRVHRTVKGGVTNTARSYMVAGDSVMTESDEDGDGVFETVAIYNPAKTEMEVFTRQADGSVRPVSAQTLAAYKKQHAAISEFWDKAFDKGTDTDKAMEMMKETQKKIRDAEKEKTDGKK